MSILWIARYYGIYSSRSRGKARKDGSLDKFGWGARSEEEPKKEPEDNPVETLSEKKSKQTWARLIKRIYEVDPHSGLFTRGGWSFLGVGNYNKSYHSIKNPLTLSS